MRSRSHCWDRGFTLIEILVVIGVIAIVAAIFGVGLGRGSEAATLRAAQRLMVSQFSAARAQAALQGAEVALVVVDDVADPQRSRRVVAVAINDAGIWRAVTDPVELPGVVGIVVGTDDVWGEALAVAIDPGDETVNCQAVRFNGSDGTVSNGGGELWLMQGEMSAAGWQEAATGLRRGLAVSRYGAIQLREEVFPRE